MRKDIEKALVEMQIEAKEIRKRTVRNIIIILVLAIFLFLVPYTFPQLNALFGIDVLIIFFGGFYIVFEAISTLYKPLKREACAFQKIVRAIQILEKSKESITYEEAYRCVKNAHETLEDIELKNLEWYKETNNTIKQFLENLQLIVLPAIRNSNIKEEHLEEIALALRSVNPSEIKTVNKKLESNYEKQKPSPRKIRMFAKTFQESMIGSILYYLTLGYGLVLIICVVYVLATNQDFAIFLREKSDVVILGGLAAFSGIAFWKKKPQISQWRSAESKKN
jgi:hypothetical protein